MPQGFLKLPLHGSDSLIVGQVRTEDELVGWRHFVLPGFDEKAALLDGDSLVSITLKYLCDSLCRLAANLHRHFDPAHNSLKSVKNS